MIKEIRKERDLSKAKWIRILIKRGKLTQYTKNGVMAYDTFEYLEYKRKTKVGRPKGSKYDIKLGGTYE